MEHTLRCNSQKCRTALEERAVVTTCSHIFCLSCSDALHLTEPLSGHVRACPVCDNQLPNPDDAVVALLNPSEEYKSSVLSGLTPMVILECAGRALAFYGYQCAQEILYQEHIARSMTERYTSLNGQMDKLIDDANIEIENLRNKIDAMHVERRKLEDKNLRLADAFRDKSRKHQNLNHEYLKLKQQQQSGALVNAADADAENILHNATNGSHDKPVYHAVPYVAQSRTGSKGSGGQYPNRRQTNIWDSYSGAVQRPGLQSSRSAQVMVTPSGRRQTLPSQGFHGETSNAANIVQQRATPQRAPLGELSQNQMFGKRPSPHQMGGMSAGMKIGRPQHVPYQDAVGGRMNGYSYR